MEQLFDYENEVQATVDSFAKQNSFVANKSRKDLDLVDKSIVHHRTYNCWKAEVCQPKKHVKSIIGIIKKHVDSSTLLKELVTVIEQELEKKAQYTRIKDYYRSNLSVSLMSTYNTIFKEIDSILKDNLASIPLSLQRAQMKQALLYQGILITIDQVKENCDIYTPAIRSHINKKVQFGTMMSIAKTSAQIAVSENYHHDTELGIKNTLSLPSTILQKSYIANKVISTITKVTDSTSTTTKITESLYNFVLITSTTDQQPSKQLKLAVKEYSSSVNKLNNTNTVLKTYSYCSDKGHNIHSCQKYKSDI
ncbi:7712_t:CDS:2, partial [Scutellospora calospora]